MFQDFGTWLRGLAYAKRAAVGPLRGLLSPGDRRGKGGRSTGLHFECLSAFPGLTRLRFAELAKQYFGYKLRGRCSCRADSSEESRSIR